MVPPRDATAPLIESDRNHWATLRDLLPHLWPAGEFGLRARVVTALICLILAKAATVTVPLLLGQAVDAVSATAERNAVNPDAAVGVAALLGLVAAYALVRTFSLALNELRDIVFARVAHRAMRRVGLRAFRHLHSLALRFHLERRTGGLSRVIERGTSGVEYLLRFSLFNIIPTLIELALTCGVLWWMFGFKYAAVVFFAVGGYVAYTVLVTEWRLKFRREMNDTDTNANARAIDSLLNYETVKYFGAEAHEARLYDRGLESYENAAVRSKNSLSVLNIGQAAIISVGVAALMGMAAADALAGVLTVGDFTAVNAYMLQLAAPLNFLGFAYREIKHALTDLETLFQLLHREREIDDAPGAQPLALTGGSVRFDHVAFGYDPRRPILEAVAFTVPAGKKLAIVGPSGAGKSTIARLLFRFYDPVGGAITVDGQDIRHITQASLRAAIGVVPQDTVLFNDSLRANIAYGRPDATQAEIEEAARRAQLNTFIASLPDGYDTPVGERGLKLSGGEKQRVAIARTILKNPAILILDEATSSLDSNTERAIQASLNAAAAGRTTLVIAHRLSTIVDADEIIVLKAGAIVEQGRHEDLLTADGLYAEMWRRQEAAADARATAEEAARAEHHLLGAA